MIHTKELSLKPIINSREGIHLTSYLVNRGDLIHLKKQIRESIDIASEHLSEIMDEEELLRFLAPLNQLFSKPKILKSFKSNIGVFRTRDSFRMISIPIDVEHLCVIATSFHVKPLLRWIQVDKEFLLLGLENDSASLYVGTQSSVRQIDTILFPAKIRKENVNTEIIEWLNEWLYQSVRKNKVPLFIAGEPHLTNPIIKKLRYPRIKKKPIQNIFDRENLKEALTAARFLLQAETKQLLEKSLVEYYWAEDMKLGKKNIFQIARAAVKGKIRKLIVADGIQIFGKLDKFSGGVSINPVHIDHEDDDLLDDLAQTVLASGGEVIVVPRDQIPKGRPILAILKEKSNMNAKEAKMVI
ncbi:MAG: hypothetical protein KDD58_06375 [Bdellovibrionales bacterium]|nr:hypothetical protein [Bdellovibrionales bacterium]